MKHVPVPWFQQIKYIQYLFISLDKLVLLLYNIFICTFSVVVTWRVFQHSLRTRNHTWEQRCIKKINLLACRSGLLIFSYMFAIIKHKYRWSPVALTMLRHDLLQDKDGDILYFSHFSAKSGLNNGTK